MPQSHYIGGRDGVMEGSQAEPGINYVAWTWLDAVHKSIAKRSSSVVPMQTLGMLGGLGYDAATRAISPS